MSRLLPSPPSSKEKEKDLWFEIPTTTLEEQIERRRKQEMEEGDVGLVDEDSSEFGLTRKDYAFLQWDIENEIARFDEEHGFDGIGYHEPDGSYIYPMAKVNELNEKRGNMINSRRKKISAQDVAIEKGLIKIRRPPTPTSPQEADH